MDITDLVLERRSLGSYETLARHFIDAARGHGFEAVLLGLPEDDIVDQHDPTRHLVALARMNDELFIITLTNLTRPDLGHTLYVRRPYNEDEIDLFDRAAAPLVPLEERETGNRLALRWVEAACQIGLEPLLFAVVDTPVVVDNRTIVGLIACSRRVYALIIEVQPYTFARTLRAAPARQNELLHVLERAAYEHDRLHRPQSLTA